MSKPLALAGGCRHRLLYCAKKTLDNYLKNWYNHSVFGIGCELMHWYIAWYLRQLCKSLIRLNKYLKYARHVFGKSESCRIPRECKEVNNLSQHVKMFIRTLRCRSQDSVCCRRHRQSFVFDILKTKAMSLIARMLSLSTTLRKPPTSVGGLSL